MSIFFDFEVGSTGRRFRRAVDSDKSHIKLLIKNEVTEKLFGDVDIGSLIELSTLPICMINEKKDVVGFMALCDHPNVTSVNPADWETWIRNMFQLYYMSRNTLFIHFMCFDNSVSEYFMEEAFISIFLNDFYLTRISMVVSGKAPDENLMKYIFIKKRKMYKYNTKLTEVTDKVYYFLYTAQRQDFCPKLRIRRAVQEDNDDIVAILDEKSPRLKETYGAYYISEIIGHPSDSGRKIIVAEHQEQAVGVMCLNSEINYKNLQTLYELRPFYGLRTATPLEKEQSKRENNLLNTFGDPIMLGKCSPFDDLGKVEETHFDDDALKENIADPKHKEHSKVNFKRHSMDHIYHQQISDDFSERDSLAKTVSQATVSFTDVLLEEEPFDYEIVNIDKSLLALPEMVSVDNIFKPTASNFDTGYIKSRRKSQSERSIRGPLMSAVRHMVYEAEKAFSGSVDRLLMQSCWKGRNEEKDRDMQNKLRMTTKFMGRVSIFSSAKPMETENIQYNGGPNAFTIELFALRNDVDERSGFDFLEAAFEIMKDYDYCIIQVPSADRAFPLLEHFCFVPSKDHISCKYALYVAHRSILGKLRVREAELIDIPSIARLMHNLDAKEIIWMIESSIHDKREFKSYVFMSGLSVVGVGILESSEHIDFLRVKFNIDPFYNHKYHVSSYAIDTGLATLKVAVVYTAFEVHFRFFAREMMRLSGSSALIWMTAYRNKWVVQKANSIASAMIPLTPRLYQINCDDVHEYKNFLTMSQDVMAFSAWFLSKRLTSIPKMCIGTSIVVVGASRTAMAFLDKLLFSDSSSYLTFTNVTLISQHGLPYLRNSNSKAEMMFPKYQTSSEKHMKSIPYTYYVNVIHGTVINIDKQKKNITLSNGSRYHYDLLFLFFGRQYQHPNYLEPLIEREKATESESFPSYICLDKPNQVDLESQITTYDIPDNVFIINNITEANRALNYIKNSIHFYQDGDIIVYGTTIHAYCCLATLLEIKVPVENIIWVEPFPPEDFHETRVNFFCNVNVDETLKEVLNTLKIKVYRSYYFQSWFVGYNHLVTQVNFLSHFHMLTLDCVAFFYYGKKGLSTEAFVAINKSGMAYNRGILIDHEFRTNDPSIYAAGPATAYFRRYDADSFKQKYYDSSEIGEKLGDQIRNQLDPLFTETKKVGESKIVDFYFEEHESNNRNRSINSIGPISSNCAFNRLPKFKKPIVTNCILPGGLQYLEVRSPGKKVPHHYVHTLQFNGFVMETFKNGYFKLHLNNDFVVDGITCLSPEKFPLYIFKNIYGHSGVILNNIHLRYSAKKVDDFYEFFRSPWAFFLYHDQTDELFAMVKELLPKGEPNGNTLADALRLVGENLSDRSWKNKKMNMHYNFEKSPHIEAITDYVLGWLSTNEVLLPMYHHPSETATYTYGVNRNDCFRRKKRDVKTMMIRKY